MPAPTAQRSGPTSTPSVNPFATGTAAPLTPLSVPSFSANATNGGQPANIYLIGLTPAFVGLSQANIVVPDLAAGTYPIVLTINGVASIRRC